MRGVGPDVPRAEDCPSGSREPDGPLSSVPPDTPPCERRRSSDQASLLAWSLRRLPSSHRRAAQGGPPPGSRRASREARRIGGPDACTQHSGVPGWCPGSRLPGHCAVQGVPGWYIACPVCRVLYSTYIHLPVYHPGYTLAPRVRAAAAELSAARPRQAPGLSSSGPGWVAPTWAPLPRFSC